MKIFLVLSVLTMPVMANVCNVDSENGNIKLCLEQMNQQIQEQQKTIATLMDAISVDEDGALRVDYIRGGRDIGKKKIGDTEGIIKQVIGEQNTKNAPSAGGFGFVSAANQVSPIVWMYGDKNKNAFQVISKSWDGSMSSDDPVLFSVNADGNVGIGTTEPKAKLDVIGTTKTQKIQLGEKWLLSGIGDGHANDDWLRLENIDGTVLYGGFAAGKLWTSESAVQSSDAELKQEIKTLENTLDKLLSLRGVTFKWKNATQKSQQIGVIAQEIEKVFPELVETGPDNMKGVNYIGLIPILLEAIKELQLQVDELKQK